MSGSLVIQDSSEISVARGSVSIFVLFRPPANCMTPPTLGRATFFTLSTDSSRNTLIDTPRIMFNQISGHPMAQSSWYITVAITPSDLNYQREIVTMIALSWKWHTLPLKMLLLLLSRFSHVWLCVTPQTVPHQASQSLGFSRQEHWSGLPFPSPMHESEKLKWSRSVVSDS